MWWDSIHAYLLIYVYLFVNIFFRSCFLSGVLPLSINSNMYFSEISKISSEFSNYRASILIHREQSGNGSISLHLH